MMDIHKEALKKIFGEVPDEIWEMVVMEGIAPPWPLPEVLYRMGLQRRPPDWFGPV